MLSSTLLASLRHDPAFMQNVSAWHISAPRVAARAALPAALDERLAAALRRRGITALYSHQAEAWQTAQAGHHFVVTTGTASGKTLCYNLPVVQALLHDPAARALYLFPTKALAHDQLNELTQLNAHLGGNALSAAAYDGDTPAHQRRQIRSRARVLLTNPDMLHTGLLPHHPHWAEFWSGLRYVVLDELHTYRGVFGSHVANVLRRLQRICRFYGAAPQFLCTSATLANPRELAEGLLEAPVTLIDRDGAPQGERHFVLYNPPVIDSTLGLRRSALLEAEELSARLVAAGVQTVVFTRSRLSVEVLLTSLRTRLAQHNTPAAPAPAVAGYRGGYLPGERRSIEEGLRSGALAAVISTNALELGIDIGGLDAALLVGYPGAVASTRQQAGRAGRVAERSLALFIASGNALDQYLVAHPAYLLGRSPEHALINPDNLAILANHLACALFELPLRHGEPFGDAALSQELLTALAEGGEVQQHGDTWFWLGHGYPAQTISLRTVSPDTVMISALEADDVAETAPAGRAVIGSLERAAAPALLHRGAIYLHQGQSYLVEHLDWEAGQAWVRAAEPGYYTVAAGNRQVQILDVEAERGAGGVKLAHGPVEVQSQTTFYRQIKLHTHETLATAEIVPPLPEQVLATDAFWLALDEALLAPLREAGQWRSDPNDYGPNWPQQRAAARARDGYRCTVCGTPEAAGREHDVHHKQPFRTFGYIAGQNTAYRQANQLENLTTLCRACHQRVEQGQRLRTGLGGLAYALNSLAPLYLMCDPGDIDTVVEAQNQAAGGPTITIYEKIPAGIGFSRRLYELGAELLAAALAQMEQCACAAGCPACVGPINPQQPDDLNARMLSIALAAACCAALNNSEG